MSHQLSEEPPHLLLTGEKQPSFQGELVIALDSCPMILTSTVEEMPRTIIRDAKRVAMLWNKTPSIQRSLAAGLEAAPGGPAMPEQLPIPLL
jgi:hypothetical protein